MAIQKIIDISRSQHGDRSSLLWNEKLQQHTDGTSSKSQTPLLDGELSAFSFAGARIYHMQSQPQLIYRERPPATRFRPTFVISLEGRIRVSQFNRTCYIEPGEFGFLDGASRFEVEYLTPFSTIGLQPPASSFTPATYHKAIARGIGDSSDLDRVFFEIIRSIWNSAEDLNPEEHGTALNSVLATCALTSPFRNLSKQVEPCVRVNRALAFIENNLSESWLNPSTVAEGQGVSRRYLDGRFKRLGLSIDQCIWSRRLARAHEALEAASRAGNDHSKTIIRIAFDTGFKSPSHFSRAFRARFGISPRDFRHQIRGESAAQ